MRVVHCDDGATRSRGPNRSDLHCVACPDGRRSLQCGGPVHVWCANDTKWISRGAYRQHVVEHRLRLSRMCVSHQWRTAPTAAFTTREVTHSPTQWSGCYSRAPTSFPPRTGCEYGSGTREINAAGQFRRGASRIPRRRGPDPGGARRALGAEPTGHLRSGARSAQASIPGDGAPPSRDSWTVRSRTPGARAAADAVGPRRTARDTRSNACACRTSADAGQQLRWP